MGKVVFITSFKGGVGKTTVTANLATALSALGQSVIIFDGDYGMRCMDLILGMENNGLFDSYDVISKRCKPDDAIIRVGAGDGLHFLPAPMKYDGSELSQKAVDELFAYLRKYYDFVLIDSGADHTRAYDSFARAADEAVVVTFHQSTAIRAADTTAELLREIGFKDIKLILNNYHDSGTRGGVLPTIFETVTKAGIQLLGVVPFDVNIVADQENSITAFASVERRKAKPYEAAFMNIARRMIGEKIPLLYRVYNPRKMVKYL